MSRMKRHAVCVLITGVALTVLVLPSRATAQLPGDCDSGGTVTVAELITLVNIALSTAPLSACQAGDKDGDGQITVAEIIAAVASALCSGPCPTPVPTRTPTSVPTAPPTPAGPCGNGVLDAGEQCDPPSDAACPGACRTAAVPAWDCVVCAAVTGSCIGPSDPSCAGTCVARSTACTCAPAPPANCPAPQGLPADDGIYQCPAACAQVGARLLYRDEIVGSAQFTEYEIELLDPATGEVHVHRVTPEGSEDFDTVLEFGGGTGGIVTPPGAGAIFGGLAVYEQLVCGWPIGCGPDGTPLIPNGTSYSFESTVGFGTTYRLALSCAGCGGGPERVNASWQGARCGLDAFARVEKLCKGFNPYVPALAAPQCCGCVTDAPCPAAAPVCVDGTCM